AAKVRPGACGFVPHDHVRKKTIARNDVQPGRHIVVIRLTSGGWSARYRSDWRRRGPRMCAAEQHVPGFQIAPRGFDSLLHRHARIVQNVTAPQVIPSAMAIVESGWEETDRVFFADEAGIEVTLL